MLDQYKAADVPASQVFAQSFDKNDILYWIENEPAFAVQAVFLDSAEKAADLPDLEKLIGYRKEGIRIVAPPIFALLAVNWTSGTTANESCSERMTCERISSLPVSAVP